MESARGQRNTIPRWREKASQLWAEMKLAAFRFPRLQLQRGNKVAPASCSLTADSGKWHGHFLVHTVFTVSLVFAHTHLLTHGWTLVSAPCTNLFHKPPGAHWELIRCAQSAQMMWNSFYLCPQSVGLHKSLLGHFVKRRHVFFPKLRGLGCTVCLLVRLRFPLPLLKRTSQL